MNGSLTENRLNYILEHLGHHFRLSEDLLSKIHYGNAGTPDNPCIQFHASEKELDLEKVIWMEGIPVLYPGSQETNSFYSFEDSNLIFHHDLLRSAFHLLSGYEEIKSGKLDEYGRFPYTESLQFQLGIIGKPVVNYYFEIILKGIEEFCGKSQIPFERKQVFSKPILMLSHDIDRLDAYSFFEAGFKLKQLLGLAPSPYGTGGKLREFITALYYFLNPFTKKNPFWSFGRMMEWERERNIRSTYYFLEKEGGRNVNSRYKFSENRIHALLRDLSAAGHEIGIHGTIQSATDQSAMNRTVNNLARVSPDPVVGIRQHYLKFTPGKTADIQNTAGLVYDASLGFAEHDGFRNSYCWPFRLYNFGSEQTMDHWEIPLTVMEGTHFYYRKLSLEAGFGSVSELLSEVLKFNGVFSLLWHNHFFDEKEFPGVTPHYLKILDLCTSKGLEGLPGKEIIDLIRNQSGSAT